MRNWRAGLQRCIINGAITLEWLAGDDVGDVTRTCLSDVMCPSFSCATAGVCNSTPASGHRVRGVDVTGVPCLAARHGETQRRGEQCGRHGLQRRRDAVGQVSVTI